MSNLEQNNIKTINKLGWIKPLETKTYIKVKILKTLKTLPKKIDFRNLYNLPKIYDQSDLGSCTAQALGFAHHFLQIKQKYKSNFTPSRLFIYYQERVYEGNINTDSGAYLSTGIFTLKKDGVCKEKTLPYIINKFKQRPTSKSYSEAKNFKLTNSSGLNIDLHEIKNALANKFPVVFGFLVFKSFLSETVTKTGIVQIPNLLTENIIGGHAVCLVGYDDNTSMFLARNSWGENWGDKGYFYIPYKYVSDSSLCDEFYALKTIKNKFTNNNLINRIKNIKKIILRK